MLNTRSKYLTEKLVLDEAARTRFVADAINAAATVARLMPYSDVMVELSVPNLHCAYRTDAIVRLCEFDRFQRARRAINDGLVDYEVRRLWPVPGPGSRVRRIVTPDEYGDIPRGIFGFYETYCCVCVTRHAKLDHVIVQVC